MDEPSSWLSVTATVAAIAVYLASLAFYRLFLHPLSRFPGPKLAAVTRYYEGYFDVYRNGEYTFKIAEMHEKYGPIIRISPYELHVSDPAFFETLYHQDKALDKYAWAVDAWGVKGGAFATSAHHVHKARRQPIAPFFSQAKVASRQDLICKHVVKLRHRLTKLAGTGETFNLGAAIAALTRDVSHDFILNKDYNSLDKEDFDVVQLDFGNGSGGVWRLSKFIRFVGPMLQSLPVSLVAAIADKNTKEFFRHLMNTQEDTRKLMAEATSSAVDSKRPRNLVDEIMNSNLPPPEKEFKRVFDDITTTTGAGFETSASVLRLVVFHVYSDAKLLARLRTELASAGATTPDHQLDWKALEQLPTLSAVLHEGLRLSPGIATRMARISPHEDIWYNNEWRIPVGTPVGMTSLLMHLDESIWPEPKHFNPDRWLENRGNGETGGTRTRMKKVKRGFAPFSKGTRMCVGLHLARAEMYLTLAHLLLHFDFRFPPDGASARDFEAVSDNFTVGTRGRGHLGAVVKVRCS